jgi:hypothetical protein
MWNNKMHDHNSSNWSNRNSNKGLKKNLKAISGKHSVDSLQETAILGISHKIQRVLQCET